MNRRPKLSIVAPSASTEEVAAVIAAVEQFMRATAPRPAAAQAEANRWQQVALREGIMREPMMPLPWS
ncbi:MAG: hypothetical protein ACYC91_12805 [Solirubrobacteraceae bacterium]